VGLTIRSPSGLAALGLAGLVALGIAGYYAFLGDWWIPVVPPALAWAGSAGAGVALVSQRERAERSTIMRLFAQHVSKDVAHAIWTERHQFMHEGRLRSRRVYLTVLFSDLKGYTTASEQLDPEILMDWINEYMAAMARLVEEHGGVVDDYAGDGVKANFGVPVPRTGEEELDTDAVHAVECALAMSEAVETLNARWRARDLPAVRMRVGITSGPAVVGSLGSAERMAYKSLGDTINTAARLESFDKESFQANPASTSRILISGETLARLGGRFPTREIGQHRLRGKHREITVYQVLEATDSPLRGTGQEDRP
jgi:adenylate cyclase